MYVRNVTLNNPPCALEFKNRVKYSLFWIFGNHAKSFALSSYYTLVYNKCRHNIHILFSDKYTDFSVVDGHTKVCRVPFWIWHANSEKTSTFPVRGVGISMIVRNKNKFKYFRWKREIKFFYSNSTVCSCVMYK